MGMATILKTFKCILPYTGMATILFNGPEPFEPMVNTLRQKALCLCWGFTAQSTQWGHVERGQFT